MKTYKSNISRVRLTAEPANFPKVKITESKDAYKYATQFYYEDIGVYESFFIILLNRANNTIAYAKISQGGVVGTYVDPVIIAKYAVDCLASSIVMVHNHPSGEMRPSQSDINITEKVKNGLRLFDINILDHIILSPEATYYSFADEGLL